MRKVKDAKDLSSNELIYFKSHAKATYMSDGTTVEDAINNISVTDIDLPSFKQALLNCFSKVAWIDGSAPQLIKALKDSIPDDKFTLDNSGYVLDGLVLYFDGIYNYMENGEAIHKDNLDMWYDLSGNNKHAYCFSNTTGSITLSAETTDNSVVFTGSTYFFSSTNDISRLFNESTAGTLEIVFKEYENTSPSCIFFSKADNVRPNRSNVVKCLWYRTSDPGYIVCTSNAPLSTSHITGISMQRCTTISQFSIVYDTNNNNGPELVEINNEPQTLVHNGGTMTSIAEFAIGGRKHNNSSETGYTFKGEIYAIRYYDRQLSQEERLLNYNNDKIRFGL